MGSPNDPRLTDKAGALVDLGLTLPIFVSYHLGVVFLNVRNASDLVTGALLEVSEGSTQRYLLVTLGIGLAFAGVFALLGRGQVFKLSKFLQIAIEGVLYAVAMRLAGAYVVANVFAGSAKIADQNAFVGVVMSLGAGFYEELAYRVVLFGLGAKLLVWFFAGQRFALEGSVIVPRLSLRGFAITFGWSLLAALAFSGVHYIGPFADTFLPASFVFRAVLGVMLTLIYVTRGFAAAVWTHALYDVWVLAF